MNQNVQKEKSINFFNTYINIKKLKLCFNKVEKQNAKS